MTSYWGRRSRVPILYMPRMQQPKQTLKRATDRRKGDSQRPASNQLLVSVSYRTSPFLREQNKPVPVAGGRPVTRGLFGGRFQQTRQMEEPQPSSSPASPPSGPAFWRLVA